MDVDDMLLQLFIIVQRRFSGGQHIGCVEYQFQPVHRIQNGSAVFG